MVFILARKKVQEEKLKEETKKQKSRAQEESQKMQQKQKQAQDQALVKAKAEKDKILNQTGLSNKRKKHKFFNINSAHFFTK